MRDRPPQRGRIAVQGEHDPEHEAVGDDHLLDVQHLDVVGRERREEGGGDAGSVVSGDGDEDGVWVHEGGVVRWGRRPGGAGSVSSGGDYATVSVAHDKSQ